MSEGLKTLAYAGIALVVSLAAFLSRPKVEEFEVQDVIGKALFEDEFDDPADAGSLEIVKYDGELGTIQSFEVARDKAGAWTIPSHGGYPADAEDRMRDAALLLVDLQVLGVASEEPADHSMFGVVEPDTDKLKVSDEGVGQLVSFKDKSNQNLASLIIGNKVKGDEEQRFVRIPGQDVVYAVKIDPDKLSTKFEDWIEKDLLKMNAWDVKNVAVKNYTVSRRTMLEVSMDRKFDLMAKYESNKWELDSLFEYDNRKPVPVELTDSEELNGDKLNDLKNAVDGLEIIDVQRKPKGLGADLKAGEGFAKNNDGIGDLNKRGFFVTGAAQGGYDLLSANGEIYVGMDSGAEYVLRFGDTLARSSDETEGDSRYLFVMARVDMSKFPPLELEDVPEMPEVSASEDGDADEPAETDDEATGEEAADADGESADADGDLEAREAEIAQERERITKENQRKIDERKEKLDKATEAVADLNVRFADWYYVVSEEQFKKVQLNREDLIKQKEKEEGEEAAPPTEPDFMPVEVPTEIPTDLPVKKSTEEPVGEPMEEPAGETTEEPAGETTEEPAGEPTEEPAGEPTEEPAGEPTEEPAGEPTEEPAGEPTEEPAGEPTEEPAGEPTEEPAGEPAAEPAGEPTEEPAGEPN